MHKSPGAQPQHLCFQARPLSVLNAPVPTRAIGIMPAAPVYLALSQMRLQKGLLTGGMLSKNGGYLSNTLFILFYRYKTHLYFIVIVLTIWEAMLGSYCSYTFS